MQKALRYAYTVIAPTYFAVAIMGYATFGSGVDAYLVDSFVGYVSSPFFVVLNIAIMFNQFFLSAIYIQAAFYLIEDIFPALGSHHDGHYTYTQLVVRLAFVAFCTFVAVALPFFADLASLAGVSD